jgi:ketosteroid isomerase-like protein
MRPITTVLALITLSGGGVAVGHAQTRAGPPAISLPPALDRVLRDYERHWQARDATGLAALFLEDGFVLQHGSVPIRGRAAIARAYQGSGGPLVLRAFAYAEADSVGYILGGYASRPGDPDAGKFTLTLRRAKGGRWMIASDMDNGNFRR